MNSYPIASSTDMDRSVNSAIDKIKLRLAEFGFCIWPLAPEPDHGIPTGFYTIGFTKIGLPEFYVSGIAPYSNEANEIINKLKMFFEEFRHRSTKLDAGTICKNINVERDETLAYQYRPIDPTRLMWGQSMLLRGWAEAEGLFDEVQGVQIVHRSDNGSFPMVSTANQLLLDWIPFGATPYKPMMEVLKNVATV